MKGRPCWINLLTKEELKHVQEVEGCKPLVHFKRHIRSGTECVECLKIADKLRKYYEI